MLEAGRVYSEPNTALVFNGNVTGDAATAFAVPAAKLIFIVESAHLAYRVVFALTVYGDETAVPVGVVDQPSNV